MVCTDGKRSCFRDMSMNDSDVCSRYKFYEVKPGCDPSENDRFLQQIDFQPGLISNVGVVGVTNECLLAIVKDRLDSFQAGPFPCEENAIAREHVVEALNQLAKRTEDREKRGVEGEYTA